MIIGKNSYNNKIIISNLGLVFYLIIILLKLLVIFYEQFFYKKKADISFYKYTFFYSNIELYLAYKLLLDLALLLKYY